MLIHVTFANTADTISISAVRSEYIKMFRFSYRLICCNCDKLRFVSVTANKREDKRSARSIKILFIRCHVRTSPVSILVRANRQWIRASFARDRYRLRATRLIQKKLVIMFQILEKNRVIELC